MCQFCVHTGNNVCCPRIKANSQAGTAVVDYTGGSIRGHYPAHHSHCDIVQGQYLLSILVFLLVHGPGEGGLRTGALKGGEGGKTSWTEVGFDLEV